MNSRTATPADCTSAKLLTKHDLAELLGISHRSVERLVKAGRIRAIKLSHKIIRFCKADVETFLASVGSICFKGDSRP
jgi:excisionase family DNA binding protein